MYKFRIGLEYNSRQEYFSTTTVVFTTAKPPYPVNSIKTATAIIIII